MPSIKTNLEQKKALDEVSEKMELLADINKIEVDEVDSITIAFSREGKIRKGAKITLPAGEKEAQKVFSALSDYRKRLVKEIKEKAKRFDIDFDEDELMLLNGKTTVPSAEENDDPRPSEHGHTEVPANLPPHEFEEADDDDDAEYYDARRRFEDDN